MDRTLLLPGRQSASRRRPTTLGAHQGVAGGPAVLLRRSPRQARRPSLTDASEPGPVHS